MLTSTDSLLVVDDHVQRRAGLARALDALGYRVEACGTAQALEHLRSGTLDLVLLDIDDQSEGLRTLTDIRRQYDQDQLPVIVMMDADQSADLARALEQGASDYMTRPTDVQVTLARVRAQVLHKRSRTALRESEERYALAARGANDGIWDWDLRTDVVYYSPRWKAIVGCEDQQIGSTPDEWLGRIHPADLAGVTRALADHQEGRTSHFESEHRVKHADGFYRWVRSRGIVVRGADGRACRMAGSLGDVTESKVIDPLTGLPNRTLFIDRLQRAIDLASRRPDRGFALITLNIDRFTLVNEGLGPHVGDQLLTAISRRLEACLRPSDTIALQPTSGQPAPRAQHTLARVNGDAFTILLMDANDPSDVSRVAQRLLGSLDGGFRIGAHEVFVSASAGIALSGTGYTRAEDVLRDADTAVSRAKTLGRGRVEVFDRTMRERAAARLRLETDLRKAIDRGEFFLNYQPIVSTATGRVSGFEALLRWSHPERGVVLPADFIPAAEDMMVIVPIGQWVIEEACRQLRLWQGRQQGSEPLAMNINLSAAQVHQPDLCDRIEQVLRSTGVPGSCLNLEITESTLMAQPERAGAVLAALKKLGVRLSIDDFGTGYSSLSYLHRLPITSLKIDRSFIGGMCVEHDCAEIVHTIIALARRLGMDVVAEGVETSDQHARLRTLACDLGQGFYYGRPVDTTTASALVGVQLPLENKTRAPGSVPASRSAADATTC